MSNKCHSLVDTTPVENPKLVAFSTEALKLLDIDSSNHDENTINNVSCVKVFKAMRIF